jgi:hypothetical protein
VTLFYAATQQLCCFFPTNRFLSPRTAICTMDNVNLAFPNVEFAFGAFWEDLMRQLAPVRGGRRKRRL